VPYLARYIFICGIPEGDLAKHIIARCQYFGYTSLKHDDNILYAQFLYKATKYPRATLTDKFPYHHEATPDGIGAWMSHKEINTLMEEGKDKIYLEIGTYDGFSAHMMAKVAKKVICIDPYDTAPGRLGQVMRNTIYPNIEKLVNITEYSQCAEWIFKDNLVDVLVIDGDHHVEAVKRDYAMYRRLVKVGGIIAFHDYGNFPTVGFAVDNCVKVDEYYKSVETLVLFKKTDKSL
jgi:predicted O-methyltransferase YrrM